MDFAQYSIEQLEGFQKDIAKEIEFKKGAKRRELMADLQRLAREAGISLDELLSDAGGKKATKPKSTVAPKYRNPNDASQTWTGRGRQPLWLAALLAEGQSLADLAV